MIIIESQYFPCVSYMKALQDSNTCYIEQWETFRKMSFRNRCIIVGSNGLINLTIPVEGGRNNKQLMKDVRISYFENWQTQHWKAITTSYAKSPFFEYYNMYVEQLIKKHHTFLIDKNMEILLWLKKIMKLNLEIKLTSTYEDISKEGVDYRNKWLPNNYLEGEEVLKYSQVFEDKLGFLSNVSIFDFIFCAGASL